MIKFPIDYGVGELHENQVATHECYIAMIKMDNYLQAMNIKEHQTVTELVERLEKILLDESKLDRTTRIGTLTSPTVRQALTTFLKDNRDVFA